MLSKKPYLLRAHFDWIIDSKWTPYLLVNAQHPAVNVPTQYVRELVISAKGVQFSARFSGQLWQIHLPLASILAIYAKENSQGLTFGAEEETQEPDETATSVKKPFLTVISNDERSKK